MRHDVTPPLQKKIRFYLRVTWKRYSWQYAVDLKERRIDGNIIPLIDLVDPSAPKGRRYVGRFDSTEADTRKCILLGVDSCFKPDDFEYRAAAWALQRLSWGADPATLPAGTRIDIEFAPGTTDADVSEMLQRMADWRKEHAK